MPRGFLFVLDSVGIGGAPDAADFGDEGANTLGHVAEHCAAGKADIAGIRSGPLAIPNMAGLGIFRALQTASGLSPGPSGDAVTGFYGAATEVSSGKDTPSGHWEIAGLPVSFDWGYFPDSDPAFPEALTDALVRQGQIPGFLGGVHASGTEIISKWGEEHIRTGKPIFYTSVDSVMQIAAHEKHFGLDKLLNLCQLARQLVDPLRIGRVIARPFIGEAADNFVRTANRRDFSVPPHEPTLLDRVSARGSQAIALGKIGDIFANRGMTETRKAPDNMAMFDVALKAMTDAGDGDLVFANFVDFDTSYGHRRDVAGYAAALEAFDRRLPEALAHLRSGDLLILTADHGCDPTWRGTDHTRERVPIIGTGPGLKSISVGLRESLADIGETIAEHLGLAPGAHGRSFYEAIMQNA